MPPKLTLEVFQQIAQSRGGECLSTEYLNNRANLHWRCSDGHEWMARGSDVKNKNTWCSYCIGKGKLDISVFQQIAQSRGGECLSTEYLNIYTSLHWRCNEGHEWYALAGNVKNQNQWCPHCAGLSKLDISIFQELAKECGGKLLTTEYTGNKQKLLLECSKGHQWEATANHIKNSKSWCPQCSKSRSEQLCREIIEKLTGFKFPNVRPDFLDGLELDGYNAEVQTAFEYNGEQHYRYIPHFHNDETAFKSQQERDQRKYKICAKKKIDLIIIPYTMNYTKPDELRTFIRDQLIACGWEA